MKHATVLLRATLFTLGAILVPAASGCQSEAGDPSRQEPQAANDASHASSKGGKSVSIKLTSTAFAEGERIPTKYTGDGEDASPPLEWSGVPEGTKELALICDDPDAPTAEPWVHWVLYKIPAEVTSLPENLPKDVHLKDPAGALQGKNSWPSGQTVGYRGPAPPPGHGTHHYYFKLYALGSKLVVEPGMTKNALLQEIDQHVLGEGQLMGTYER